VGIEALPTPTITLLLLLLLLQLPLLLREGGKRKGGEVKGWKKRVSLIVIPSPSHVCLSRTATLSWNILTTRSCVYRIYAKNNSEIRKICSSSLYTTYIYIKRNKTTNSNRNNNQIDEQSTQPRLYSTGQQCHAWRDHVTRCHLPVGERRSVTLSQSPTPVSTITLVANMFMALISPKTGVNGLPSVKLLK